MRASQIPSNASDPSKIHPLRVSGTTILTHHGSPAKMSGGVMLTRAEMRSTLAPIRSTRKPKTASTPTTENNDLPIQLNAAG